MKIFPWDTGRERIVPLYRQIATTLEGGISRAHIY
jgi:hypothetical protein